jgi:2-polyprenyl-3-methyl-5-hydroxy-6-metoxy-1,4-benzoquinol methylase
MKQSFLQPKWGKSTTFTRFKQLEHFFKGKDILDIGCAVGYEKKDWLHAKIKEVAKSVYAVDVDRSAIEKIKSLGYEVEYGDAQNFSIGRKFDLVHAGELIEHLDNAGGFLKSVREHLTPDGLLLLTTPNGLRISNTIYAATGGLKVNWQHTCWYCEYTLKTLLDRMGLEVVEVGYLRHETYSVVRKIFLKLRSWILPDRVAWNTVYVTARLKRS